jgi:hypothetical protein
MIVVSALVIQEMRYQGLSLELNQYPFLGIGNTTIIDPQIDIDSNDIEGNIHRYRSAIQEDIDSFVSDYFNIFIDEPIKVIVDSKEFANILFDKHGSLVEVFYYDYSERAFIKCLKDNTIEKKYLDSIDKYVNCNVIHESSSFLDF